MKPISILYENEDILLINKSFGVSVQGGKGISHPLDEELTKQVGYKVHLVHRLDKDTSGILIVAKNSSAAAKWIELISSKKVKKEYMALCLGNPLVNGKALKNGTLVSTIEAHGRKQSAETFFEVENSYKVSIPEKNNADSSETSIPEMQSVQQSINMSLVHITLGTGRMHQIRIQMAKSRAPLAADDQHGDFKKNKLVRKLGIKKLQLAAYRLTIPIDGNLRTFEIPLPEHMQNALDSIAPYRM